MTTVLITVIEGSNDFAVPSSDAETTTTQDALDTILSAVANLTYTDLLAVVKDSDDAGGSRTLNCLLTGATYLGEEVPTASNTQAMFDAISTALLADADITSISLQVGDFLLQPSSGGGSISLPGIERTVFVDEGTNTTEDGTIQNPFHTFEDAITYVNTQSPSSSEPWRIVGIGDGATSEILEVPQYVDIEAPGWTITGSLALADNVNVKLKSLVVDGGVGVNKYAGTGTSIFEAETIIVGVGAIGANNSAAGSRLYVNVKQMVVTDFAYGIGDPNSTVTYMNVRVDEMVIVGDSASGLNMSGAGKMDAYVGRIIEEAVGQPSAVAVTVLEGEVNLFANTLESDSVFFVGGSGEVNCHAQAIIGASSAVFVESGGIARLTYSKISGATGGTGTLLTSAPA